MKKFFQKQTTDINSTVPVEVWKHLYWISLIQACFTGGMYGVASRIPNIPQKDEYLNLAKELTKTCARSCQLSSKLKFKIQKPISAQNHLVRIHLRTATSMIVRTILDLKSWNLYLSCIVLLEMRFTANGVGI